MEDPRQEITAVVHSLTQSPPSIQRETIETYFSPNASFTHPFCRTGSWSNSRFFIRAIYRWYKIMSPKIDIAVNSIAYDEQNLILYVNISQVFRIWIVPFYRAPVNLTTVITLDQNTHDGKYYIQSQNDLYQVDEFVKFAFPQARILVWIWHYWATFFCLLGSFLFYPVSTVEQWAWEKSESTKEDADEGLLAGIEMRDLGRKNTADEVWWKPAGSTARPD